MVFMGISDQIFLNIYYYLLSSPVYLFRKKKCVCVLPPEALVTADPEGATLVTAAGLYVQDVPHTSTFRSLSE